MKKYIFIIIAILPILLNGQDSIENKNYIPRQYKIRSFMDTSNVVFQDIYNLWQNYQAERNLNFQKKEKTDFSKYWHKDELEKYGDNCDLYSIYAFNYYTYQNKELFIGINKRNDTLYELQSVYYMDYDGFDLTSIITVPVIKIADNEYRLYNKFSLNRNALKTYKKDFITYFFPENYNLDKDAINETIKKVKEIYQDLGINKIKPITYYIDFYLTDIVNRLGLQVYLEDFVDIEGHNKNGKTIIFPRLLIYTSDGEKNVHEFLHILLDDLRDEDDTYTNFLDEGFCSFFGDHQGSPYKENIKMLKEFLNDNNQIDLSVDLTNAYKIDGKFYSVIDKEENIQRSWMVDREKSINYSYILAAVIYDIAFRNGGYDKVKQIALDKRPNDKIYDIIKDHLSIERKDVNSFIRNFINSNY
ncbi:MAG: hypothetical protein LBM25_02580 [Bacteroidales bacterium]|nr:hypothetical protein [Bacteroidales bacterium]